MTIIVDAYNYIKHISGHSFISEGDRASWKNRFKEYVSWRHNSVILVFDAGPGLYKTVEQVGGFTVIYSGQSQTADDVIKSWLQERHGQDVLLVTSDREIRDVADEYNIASISSEDFYKIFNHILQQQEHQEAQVVKTVHKTSQEDVAGLDELMEMGSRDLAEDDLQVDATMFPRVRNGKKAAKSDKRLMRKIEKI